MKVKEPIAKSRLGPVGLIPCQGTAGAGSWRRRRGPIGAVFVPTLPAPRVAASASENGTGRAHAARRAGPFHGDRHETGSRQHPWLQPVLIDLCTSPGPHAIEVTFHPVTSNSSRQLKHLTLQATVMEFRTDVSGTAVSLPNNTVHRRDNSNTAQCYVHLRHNTEAANSNKLPAAAAVSHSDVMCRVVARM